MTLKNENLNAENSGTLGIFRVFPKRVPKGVPDPPLIAKQVIDCEKLSTSDVEIGYGV